ncbi:hypothetical protein [Gracilinema caldarium]|uniref:hypothetical protein n=1 Tax=Gracilinema caldarium TaxID=215591 RepID=UPI0003076E3A|nr:hypothetical protein [Gracilinema caldarium]
MNIYPDLERGFEAINSIGEVLTDEEIEENEGKEIVEIFRYKRGNRWPLWVLAVPVNRP